MMEFTRTATRASGREPVTTVLVAKCGITHAETNNPGVSPGYFLSRSGLSFYGVTKSSGGIVDLRIIDF